MKSTHAQSLLDTIDRVIADYSTFSHASPLEESYLAKFLVVYISGIYEEVIETILNEFVAKNTSKNEVANFTKNSLDFSFRNPNSQNLLKLLKRFENKTWEKALTSCLKSRINALDSINTNKNAIAHGTSITLTLGDVKQYYNDSRPLIEIIDEVVL